jgi:ribosomal-protein-alanine N-acetyltransferase
MLTDEGKLRRLTDGVAARRLGQKSHVVAQSAEMGGRLVIAVVERSWSLPVGTGHVRRDNAGLVPPRRPVSRLPQSSGPLEYGRRMRGFRVYLRRLGLADEAEFLRLVRESRDAHYPWVAPPAGGAGFGRLLQRAHDGAVVSLLVRERTTRALVGVFNLSQISRGNFRSAYLGYYGHVAFAGRGYMTEGLVLVIRYAFGKVGLHRIEANIQPANRRSIALVEKCGFKKEGFSPRYLKVAGRWRDHERWAITVEGWRDRTRRVRTKE